VSTVRRSLAYSFLARYAYMAIAFISIAIISRLLTPEEIGVFSVSMAIVGLGLTLRQFGLSTYLVQEKTLTEDRIRTVFGLALIIAWGIGALLAAGSGIAAGFYGEPGVRDVLLVLAINFLLVPIGSPALALLQREMRFGDIGKVQISAAIVQTLVTIPLVMTGLSYLSLAIGSVVGNLVTILTLIAVRAPHVLILPNLREWRHVLRFCFPAVGSQFAGEIGEMAPDLAMGKLLGFDPVAYFSRAQGLVNVFRDAILSAVWPVALSAFSDARRKNGDLGTGYGFGIQLLTGISIPFYCVLAALAEPVVLLLYGEQWGSSVPLLQVLCLAQIVIAPWAMISAALYALGRARDVMIGTLAVQTLRVALVVAAAFHSVMAVALAQVAVAVVGACVNQYFLKRGIGVGALALAAMLRRSVILALLAAAPAVAMMIWVGDDRGRWLYAMPIGAAGAALAWLLGVYLCNHPIRNEIARLVPTVWNAWSRLVAARRS
jgi:O-antigen/teichoic acid export membrane protein